MTICPKCKAENRPEAAFCSRCGTILFIQPAPPEPVADVAPAPEPAPPIQEPAPQVEEPAYSTPNSRRSEESIFGGRYKYDALIYQNEHETHYTVTELCEPPAPCVRICSNPACRTIHSPIDTGEEKYCTYCGSPLEQNPPLLMIQEADHDRYGSLQPIIDAHLAYPHIHPPLAIFQQEVPGGVRYCLVSPYSQELPSRPEISRILEWGIQLATGLDYLHSHGIAFGEEVDPAGFGLVEDKIVWRNFSNVRILPMLADREKINNVRQLALSLYAWMTGKSTYRVDPALSPELNELFHRALVDEGFTSGAELASQIEQTIKTGISPLNITYQVGRRTHTGKRRSKNEDSLVCLTLCRLINGISRPAGVFAIADGMGGHTSGELASNLAVESLTQKASPELGELHNRTSGECIAWLKDIVQAANQAVYEKRQNTSSDMGSTMVCALMVGSQAYIAHLGDSRSYLLRGDSIQQLTSDHSLVQHLVDIGQIQSQDARNHPQRNVIFRSLGEKPQVIADICIQNLLPGDKILLCSDGCSGMLDDQQVRVIIQETGSPQAACDQLIEAANLAGGEDNISVILVEITGA